MMFIKTLLFAFALIVHVSGESWKVSRDVSKVRYFLATRATYPNLEEIKHKNYNSIKNSHFDNTKKTKIIVHGYKDSHNDRFNREARKNFLHVEDCNVISMEWRALAEYPYPVATKNVYPVAIHLTEFVRDLQLNHGMLLRDLHPVGFSLGAQVVGMLGRHLNGVLPRVTGLDPAGSPYRDYPRTKRISEDSAQYVDIIHSAGLNIGSDMKLGHVDFFPNNGQHQPGCQGEDAQKMDCSHHRAHDYFTESIISKNGFIGYKCNSWDVYKKGDCNDAQTNVMGYPSDKSKPGIYYLHTNDDSPYAL